MAALTPFDFTSIRNTAIDLVKVYGGTPCLLIRVVDGSPVDITKPWRPGAATTKRFAFSGSVSTLGFPRRSDPVVDMDADIIAPGDIVTTTAVGDPNTVCGSPLLTDFIQVVDGGLMFAILGIKDIKPGIVKPVIFLIRGKPWPQIAPQPSMDF